jgi:hypothetical protein
MKATIKLLTDELGIQKFYATSKEKVNPGDFSFNGENQIVQANQSTCVWFTHKVIGLVNPSVKVEDGEEVLILFKCAKEKHCGYPFCGKECGGNSGFYVAGREDRGY